MQPLPIFPDNGLSNSVIPPVFIGLGISTVFAETLGWNFSGLIVPGYLAPIFIVKPISAIVIVIEAVISYLVLRLLSEGFSKTGTWTSFFGQDAFFALFCISLLVKSAMEGPLLPVIGDFLNGYAGLNLDFRNEFHSTGLIIVPLMANIFWRHGFRRNLIPSVVVIGSTYLITRFVLIPGTNFSVNAFELFYSKMATDFADSPQFYLILLMGTVMAARNKYQFGWAYHGMLIPALLGIAWLTPLKILTTFLEAGLILWIGRTFVQSRIMRNITIEGPRKLLFLFSIGFALKMITGFALMALNPGFLATDIYGFAYILPSLIALEMWTRGSYIKVARISIQTSFLAFLFGLLLSVLFNVYLPSETTLSKPSESSDSPQIKVAQSDILKCDVRSWLETVTASQLVHGSLHDPLNLKQLVELERKLVSPLVRSIRREKLLQGKVAENFDAVIGRYDLQRIDLIDPVTQSGYIAILDAKPKGYHGIYLFRLADAAPFVIEIPHPLTESQTLQIGTELFQNLNARALFISGASRRKDIDEFDVTHLQNRRSMFQLMHQVIHREYISHDPLNTIQVRGAARLDRTDMDVLADTSFILPDIEKQTETVNKMLEFLKRSGIVIRTSSGNREEAGYSHNSNAQYVYNSSFKMGQFVSLWFSKSFRESVVPTSIKEDVISKLGWTRFELSCAGILTNSSPHSHTDLPAREELIANVAHYIDRYRLTENVIYLREFSDDVQSSGFTIGVARDSVSGADFIILSCSEKDSGKCIVINPNAQTNDLLVETSRDSNAVQQALFKLRMSCASALVMLEDK